ncbi:hypothetical protein [Bradyrhizobium sp. JR3.5]
MPAIFSSSSRVWAADGGALPGGGIIASSAGSCIRDGLILTSSMVTPAIRKLMPGLAVMT